MQTSKRLTAVVLLALLTACGKTPTPAPAPPPAAPAAAPGVGSTGGRNQIAFITASVPTPEDFVFQTGASKAQSEFKIGPDGKPIVDVVFKSTGGSGEKSGPNGQLDLAHPLIDQGISAIIIEPDNQEVLNAIIAAAKGSRAHPPIIAINTTLDTSGCKSTLNPDNVKIGQLAADQFLKSVKPGGTVVILPGIPPAATAAIDTSFRNAVADVNKGHESALLLNLSAPLDALKGDPKAPPYQSGPGQHTAWDRDLPPLTNYDALFAPDETTTISILSAMEKTQSRGTTPIIAVGNSEKLLRALKDKKLAALILTDPRGLAYQAVKTAGDCMREKKVQKEILIAPRLATAENLASPEIAPLLPSP